MRYRTLVVENFGPFYGPHELRFDRNDGIWIVYGDNGRGKTTLLNAFRFALYGKVFGRRTERRLGEMANSLHAEETGQTEFKTILEFEHEGKEFRLTRRFVASRSPQQIAIVEQGGRALSDDEAKATMQAIAPESISQFFLFDGELLRQYEDLRNPSVDSGKNLREEVDRILGVHAIENAVRDLREINAAVSKEKARKLVEGNKAEQLAQSLAEAEDIRGRHVTSLMHLKSDLQGHLRRIDELEQALARYEQASLILERIDMLRSQESSLETQLHRATEALQELVGDAWKAVLGPAVRAQHSALREEAARVNEARVEAIVANRTSQHLEASSQCPVCETALDHSRREGVLARAQMRGSAEEVARLDRVVADLQRRAEMMEVLATAGQPELLAEREKGLSTVTLELSEVREDIAAYEEDLRGIEVGEVRQHQRERDQRLSKINGLGEDIRDTENQIRLQEEVIATVKRELNKLNVTTNPVLELKDEVSSRLLKLFGEALISYQDELLRRVEDQASKLFMDVRTEGEYARLKIHDGYGLTIVDDRDTEVRGHSAGYEHLVALSLIAALQQCSPVQGPIVMDSPFGRLDEVHTSNVVTALPQIADQVVLLAFPGEFDRQTAVAALGNSLACEYELKRVSSRQTEIERREDVA